MKPVILVVDDEPDVTAYLTILLEDHGFDVITASDGEEAMNMIIQVKPDLISMDLAMPNQTGLITYQKLKAESKTADIPIVILTGVGTEFKRHLATYPDLPPPDAYFEKPIRRDAYIKEIKKLTGIES